MNKDSINRASKLIKNGGVIIFPTETVYGLGASIFDEKAIKKIYKIKGRPSQKGLIIHIAKFSDLDRLAKNIPVVARKLAKKHWPGPLTLVLKKKKIVLDIVTGGGDTVAIRMPRQKETLALIRQAGPIVGPSANFHNQKPPRSIKEVSPELLKKVDFVLDGGQTSIGIPSTIVDFTQKPFKVLRPGAIDVV